MTTVAVALVAGLPAFDIPNPFASLAKDTVGQVILDGWTAAMLGLWSAGLWVLRAVLGFVDGFLVPDLSPTGPAAAVYAVTFWLAATLAVVLAAVQLGLTVFRRDGKALATAVVGAGQFLLVWGIWVGYGVTLVAACGGLTTALMQVLLGTDTWAGWQPWPDVDTTTVTDATVATVLGLLGLVLWVAAIGHTLVMLTRAGALIVLAVTAPIAAAGLLADAGRGWFWTSLRWFHAAALTPVLLVLILGLGVRITTGVAKGATDSVEAAVGTAIPGVVLILIGCVAPLALFKLLAFVDPGTTSGAALRAGYAAHGGLSGLLSRGDGTGSSSAAETDGSGRAAGEAAADEQTSSRFNTTLAGGLGPAAAMAVGVAQSIGSRGAAIGIDLAGQMGVGHPSYFPDTPSSSSRRKGSNQNTDSTGEGTPGQSDAAVSEPRSTTAEPSTGPVTTASSPSTVVGATPTAPGPAASGASGPATASPSTGSASTGAGGAAAGEAAGGLGGAAAL